ncbi:MAG: TspO/MBR family protein [Pseudomonadota bacterium]
MLERLAIILGGSVDLDSFIALAVFCVAAFGAASAGGLFAPGEWYERLNHPSWRPPNWLFPVVWTPLYIMIAVSGFLVWKQAGWGGATLAYTVYFVHLVINFAWSGIFFGLKRMDWGLIELIALWLSIVATMVVFAPYSATAVWLLVPYLIWVTFAGYLNFVMLRLNPDAPRS